MAPTTVLSSARWISILALLLLALAASLLACGPNSVTLGAVLPLSGDYASYGTSIKAGLDFATEEINRGGGISGRPLKFIIRDSRSSPQEASDSMRWLITEKQVPAVIGGCTSGEALAMAPIAEAYHRVLLSPSASTPRLTDAGDFVFRDWPSDLLEAGIMADFAAYTLPAQKILVLSSESPYAEGIRSAFEERFESPPGPRRVEILVFRSREPAWDEIAAQVRGRTGIHALYLVGYEREIAPFLKALKKAGVDLPTLTVSAVDTPRFRGEAGPAGEGLLFPRPLFNPEASEEWVRHFVDGFRQRYRTEPDVFAAHAYDAVKILSFVIAAQGSRPETIQRGLLGIRNFPGASGAITFDAAGDVVQPPQICVIRGGRVLPLLQVQEEILPPLQRKVEALRFGR